MFGTLKKIRGLWLRALLLAYYWFALVIAVLLPLWIGNSLVDDAGLDPLPALLLAIGMAAVVGWFEFLFLRRHIEAWILRRHESSVEDNSRPVS